MKRVLLLTFIMMAIRVAAQPAMHDHILGKGTTTLPEKGWLIQHESLSYDHQTLYLSAKEPDANTYALYYSTKKNGKWSEPIRLSNGINQEGKDILWPSISPDEQELYYAVRETTYDGKKPIYRHDLYVAQREGEDWGKGEQLVVSDGGATAPTILPDGKTLLYSASYMEPKSRTPHFGLCYIKKSNKYHWTLPQLLEKSADDNINLYGAQPVVKTDGTYQIQMTQEIVSRKDTVYQFHVISLSEEAAPDAVLTLKGVVTDGLTGKRMEATIQVYDAVTQTPIALHHTNEQGAYTIALPQKQVYSLDITAPGYSHKYLDMDCQQLEHDSQIEDAIQLTPELDVTFYLFDAETNTSLGEEKKRLAINQLYDIELERHGYETQHIALDTRKAVLLPSSELDVLMQPSKAPLQIVFIDGETNQTIHGHIVLTNLLRDQVLDFSEGVMAIRQGDSYLISVNQTGYMYYDTIINIPMGGEPINLTFTLIPIREEMVMQLKNIQFETASADLTEESFTEIDNVVKLLRDNRKLKIELSAHTDNIGSDSSNQLLSDRRGEAVRQYILRQGIDPERISSKGYGKTRPLVPNDTDEHRAMNRRVEFTVIEI